MSKRKIFFILVVLSLVTVPYLAGLGLDSGESGFVGFLINPYDGNSYLAKMQLGIKGEWRFELPYTAEPGEGAYLFLFYIILGHICRLTGFAPIIIFHFVRVLSAAVLFLMLDVFFRKLFANKSPELAQKSFYLAAIGSGLGWITSFFGMMTPDLWVPEGYPFFSAYATPHFALGMAILLMIFTLVLQKKGGLQFAWMMIAGASLAVIMPFGVVIAGIVLGVQFLCDIVESRKLIWKPLVFTMLLGGPMLLYQYWITITDPVLAGWNLQNITSAPPIWELIIGFSPAIFVAIWGIRDLRHVWEHEGHKAFADLDVELVLH